MDAETRSRLKPWAWYTAGAHVFIGCAWPLLGNRSYQKIMGHKDDMWLMTAMSLMFGVTGTAFARAAATDRITPEIAQVAVGASLAVASTEIVNVARGRIPATNLLDTLGHITIAAGWLGVLAGKGARSRRDRSS